MFFNSIILLIPEIILATFSMTAIIVGVFSNRSNIASSILWCSCFLFIVLALWILMFEKSQIIAFGGAFVADSFADFVKVLLLVCGAIILGLSSEYLKQNELLKFEYPVLISLAMVGMMLMVSSTNLISLYMSIELQSLALYVIAAFRRDSLKSTEAGLKYFVLGALSSGLFLYGASLVYGFTGSTSFQTISDVVKNEQITLGLLFGLIFLVVGMLFKIAAVPFHMWTPDVYEGSPTPVTAFFSSIPKLAAMAMFVRLLFEAFGGALDEWQQILVFVSISSMLVGSIAAIGQNNIKRLMAYSSIAHAGFALIGLAAGTVDGLAALLIYLLIYVITNVGVFSFILSMKRDGIYITEISSLSLYSKVNPARALFLSILILSLAGLPPLVGFFGKLYVFNAAIDAGFIWLAICGGVASVIGAFYYLRIVYLLYFGQSDGNLSEEMSWLHRVTLGLAAFLILVGTVNLFGLEEYINQIAHSIVIF